MLLVSCSLKQVKKQPARTLGIGGRGETRMYRERRKEKREERERGEERSKWKKKVKSKCSRNASNVQLIKLVTWELILEICKGNEGVGNWVSKHCKNVEMTSDYRMFKDLKICFGLDVPH